MKARQHTLFFFISLLSFLLASCSMSVGANTHEDEQAHLSLAVGNLSSRTILPDDITASDITMATLKIEQGKTEINTWWWWADSDRGMSAIDVMQTDTNIYITPDTYTFTLELHTSLRLSQRGVITDKTVFSGENTLDFTAEYASDASGSLSLTFTWSEDDRISDIQVGLFSAESDGEVEVEEYEVCPIWRDDENQIAEYVKWIPMGEYFVRVDMYGDTQKYGQEKINTIEDVVRILPGCDTKTTVQLSDIITIYSITYNLNDGWWVSGFEPVEWRDAHKIVTLPTASDIERTGYRFDGWFTSSDDGETLTGNAVTRIGAGTTGDLTLWAKWTRLVAYTALEVTLIEHSDITVSVTADGTPLTGSGAHSVEKGALLCFSVVGDLSIGDYTRPISQCLWTIDDATPDAFSGASLDSTQKTLTLDTAELAPGTYDIVLEVTDILSWSCSYWAQLTVKE